MEIAIRWRGAEISRILNRSRTSLEKQNRAVEKGGERAEVAQITYRAK